MVNRNVCTLRSPLRLEPLEDRTAPAVITVTTFANEADVNPATITIAGLGNSATNPDGQVSLREAIYAANNTPGADTIVLAAGIYNFADLDTLWHAPDALPPL